MLKLVVRKETARLYKVKLLSIHSYNKHFSVVGTALTPYTDTLNGLSYNIGRKQNILIVFPVIFLSSFRKVLQ